MRKTSLIVAAAVTAVVVVGTAAAHVEPAVEEAPAGGSTIIPFVVGHGCEGSPTRSRVDPDRRGRDVREARSKPGWKMTVKRGRLPQPVKDFAGNTVTRGVLEVTWSGGNLPDWQYDTFDILLGMPNTPGKTVYFPAVQRCTRGVIRWIQIPRQRAGRAGPPGAGSEAREVERCARLGAPSRTRAYGGRLTAAVLALAPAAAAHGGGGALGFRSTVTEASRLQAPASASRCSTATTGSSSATGRASRS